MESTGNVVDVESGVILGLRRRVRFVGLRRDRGRWLTGGGALGLLGGVLRRLRRVHWLGGVRGGGGGGRSGLKLIEVRVIKCSMLSLISGMFMRFDKLLKVE